jgi:hypothetical protein
MHVILIYLNFSHSANETESYSITPIDDHRQHHHHHHHRDRGGEKLINFRFKEYRLGEKKMNKSKCALSSQVFFIHFRLSEGETL